MFFLWRETDGSVLIVVAAIVFIVCLSLLLVPLYARLSAVRAEQQAVADQTALAGANAIARSRTSLLVLDAIDYKFTEYIATAAVLLAAVTALTVVPYVGEVAASLIEPVGTLLDDLAEWKLSFDSRVADPARRGIRKIAPYYSMAISARIATGNGYTGMALPLGVTSTAQSKTTDGGSDKTGGKASSSGREAVDIADSLARIDRQLVGVILGCRPIADRLASISAKGFVQVNGDARRLQGKLVDYSKISQLLGGSNKLIDVHLSAGKKAVQSEREVVAALATLIDSTESWQSAGEEPDISDQVATLKASRQRISSIIASRGALVEKSREVSNELQDASAEQVQALARARIGLAQAQASDFMQGEEGVVALVFKKAAIPSVPSGGLKMNLLAISAAKPLVDPHRKLDLWGGTELLSESKISSGITTVAKMLSAGDKLMSWARYLGDVVLSSLGEEPPELHVYEPVLVNTASVGGDGDKIGKVLKSLHRGRDSLYRTLYVPAEKGLAAGQDRKIAAAARAYWRPISRLINKAGSQ